MADRVWSDLGPALHRDPSTMITNSRLPGRTPTRARVRRTGADLLTVLRPWFLPVPMVPFLAGRVLADPDRIPAVITDPAVWWGIGCIALAWAFVAIINDRYDRSADAANPRRRPAALASERLGRRRLAVGAGGTAVFAVSAAAMISATFVVGVAVVLALGLAYSAPPIRLKSRPGLDVLANAVPIGLLAPLAGWQLAAPTATFPWQLGVLGVLTGAALYLPTTMMDRVADSRAGIRTTAVVLGPMITFRIGVMVWLGAAAVCLGSTAAGVFLPVELTGSQLIAWCVAVLSYPILMRRPSLLRLAVVSSAIGVHAMLILISHLGW